VIKHVSKDIIVPFKGNLKQQELWTGQIHRMWELITGAVEPQKGRNSCPQLPLLGLSLKGHNNVFILTCFIALSNCGM
jgi:hypothetical protein